MCRWSRLSATLAGRTWEMRSVGRGLSRSLAMCAAALSLASGGTAWSAAQSSTHVALASSCGNHSEGSCDSKAARAEDSKETTTEKQCRAGHTEKLCRDRARVEDKEEKATECDEEGNGDGNS